MTQADKVLITVGDRNGSVSVVKRSDGLCDVYVVGEFATQAVRELAFQKTSGLSRDVAAALAKTIRQRARELSEREARAVRLVESLQACDFLCPRCDTGRCRGLDDHGGYHACPVCGLRWPS